MATISLAMIVKNEEETIERVLTCAKSFCDEMIVVDTGSTDKTVELAQKMGAKIFHFEWIDDFAAARNYSFAQATCDWIIWLDADDVIEENEQKRFSDIKHTVLEDLNINVIVLPYHYTVSDSGEVLMSHNNIRIVRNTNSLEWVGKIHEILRRRDGVGIDATQGSIAVMHRPLSKKLQEKKTRNIKVLERELKANQNDIKLLFLHAHELFNLQEYRKCLKSSQKVLDQSVHEENTLGEKISREHLYSIKFYIAICKGALNFEEGHIAQAFIEAYDVYPQRAEPLYKLAEYYSFLGKHSIAYLLLTQASKIELPSSGFIQVYNYVYDYAAAWGLAVSAFELGRYAQCKEIWESLLSAKKYPVEKEEQLLNNIQIVNNILSEQNSSKPTLFEQLKKEVLDVSERLYQKVAFDMALYF